MSNVGKTTRIRIVCDAASHAEHPVIVASYKRTLIGGVLSSSWEWEESKAWGTTGVKDPWTQQDVVVGSWRPADDDELTADTPYRIELPQKRAVRVTGATSDLLKCARCDLSRNVNSRRMNDLLTRLSDSGVSKVGLQALVATLS